MSTKKMRNTAPRSTTDTPPSTADHGGQPFAPGPTATITTTGGEVWIRSGDAPALRTNWQGQEVEVAVVAGMLWLLGNGTLPTLVSANALVRDLLPGAHLDLPPEPTGDRWSATITCSKGDFAALLDKVGTDPTGECAVPKVPDPDDGSTAATAPAAPLDDADEKPLDEDDAVKQAVVAINDIHDRVIRVGIDGLVEIGRIVLDVAYDGDPELYRSKDPTKGVGLRKIAEHPDLRLPGDAKHRSQALARAIGMYLTFTALPEPVRPALSVAHVEALLPVKDGALRNQLAEQAAKERPTDREFRKAVRRAREHAGEFVRRTVRAPGQSSPASPNTVAPLPVQEGADWAVIATRLLDDGAGRKALDAVLAGRGLRITVTESPPTPRPKKGKSAPSAVDTSNWSIREPEIPGARVTVRTEDLRQALRVMPCDTADNDMAGHVAFRVLGERLEVLSYRGRLFAAIPLRADGEVGCSWTMGAKRLTALVKSIKNETLVIGFDANLGVPFVKVADSTLTFQSLNPESFPFWDEVQADAKPTATLPARQLAAALAYSKLFVPKENGLVLRRNFCVSEAREGILHSTNNCAATLVKVPGLEQSTFRVHGDDAGTLCFFLDSCKGGEAELMEHDRVLFVRRADGAVFGETRFRSNEAFRGFKVNMDEVDQRTWTLPKDLLQRAMAQLATASRPRDNGLRFVLGEDGRFVTVSMAAATGGSVAVDVPLIDTHDTPDAPPLPAAGFVLDRESLRKVLSAWDGDAIKLGLNVIPAKNRGFCRFVFERDGNKYLTIAAWLIEPTPEPQHERATSEEESGEVLDEPEAEGAVDEARAHGEGDVPDEPVADAEGEAAVHVGDEAQPDLNRAPEPRPDRAPDTPWSRNDEGAWERQVDGLHVVVVPGDGAEVLVTSGVPLGYKRTQYAFGNMSKRYVRELLGLPENMRLDYRSDRQGRERVHRVFPVAPSKATAFEAAVKATFSESR